ncbi:hypothetical protein EUGRSUZ_H00330 [Eucalyptus grandis]|uniref:Uncharacterized protein n=3 Tax=Eucalyptus TaxID=3932 RepID=A0ACC3JLA5_EUCGR|nr:hypothetical protein EUGRSUZ_H00330 [Eucalyptus grandis]
MAARRSVIGPIVLVLIVFVALLGLQCTEAMRVLPEDFARANNLASYSSSVLSEQARQSMARWLQRLDSGPSPKGPGH